MTKSRDDSALLEQELSKTTMRRLEQHRDRWSSYGGHTGILAISDKPSVAAMRSLEVFQGLEDRFLERISPDVSIVLWRPGAVLFEQGAYLDLAFFIAEGEVEIFYEGAGQGGPRAGSTERSQSGFEPSQSMPIFDANRTGHLKLAQIVEQLDAHAAKTAASPSATSTPVTSPPATQIGLPSAAAAALRRQSGEASGSEISFLASFDFDLAPGQGRHLGPGELFGEIGAMSGWPQSATARTRTDCRLVQIRVPALRLLKRVSKPLREKLDRLYRERALHQQLQSTPLFRQLSESSLRELEDSVDLVSLEPGEVLAREGERVDALYMVRSGFLRLGQRYGGGEIVATYLSKGMTYGEAEILIDDLDSYELTASSVEYSELVKIPLDVLKKIMAGDAQVVEDLWNGAVVRLKEVGASRGDPGRSAFVERALDTGLVQGNSVLLIDLDACTRCDDCVRACAETHGGRPRFVREGERLGNFLVPRSCYHCRDPVCLIGCPTGAIHRAGIGDVVAVDDEICIGCATCANNCPYDAIVMHDTGEIWPGDMVPTALRGQERLVASKCDLCAPLGHDPACVSNCPQGCAFRVGSLDEIRDLVKGGE